MAETEATQPGSAGAEPQYASLEDYLKAAEQAGAAGSCDEAVDIMRAAALKYPDSPTAQFELAAAVFAKLKLDLSHMAIWENLADEEELAEECFNSLQAAIGLDEGFVAAHNLMGTLLAVRGRKQRAIEAWEKSLAIEPNQPDVREDVEDCRASLEA